MMPESFPSHAEDPAMLAAFVVVCVVLSVCLVSILVCMFWRRRRHDDRLPNLAGKLKRAGVRHVRAEDLLQHEEAGGDTEAVVEAMLLAHANGLEIAWESIGAIDLEGEDAVAFVRRAIEPWTIAVPPINQLNGKPISGFTRDGGEVLIRGEAVVRARPNILLHPIPEMLVADIASHLMTAVREIDSRDEFLENPKPVIVRVLNNRRRFLRCGLELMDFKLTQLEPGRVLREDLHLDAPPAEAVAADDPADRKRRVAEALLAERFADCDHESLSPEEQLELATALRDAGKWQRLRNVCETVMQENPLHPMANRLMRDSLVGTGTRLGERLAFASRCIEKNIKPVAIWHLIKASLLCQMAVRSADGGFEVTDDAKFQQAWEQLDSAEQLSGSVGALNAEHNVISNWRDEFPLMFDDIRFQRTVNPPIYELREAV